MKAREYLTDEQKKFIEANCMKKFIREMSNDLGITPNRVHKYLTANNIAFKSVSWVHKVDKTFKEGCFNPHERENWLV